MDSPIIETLRIEPGQNSGPFDLQAFMAENHDQTAPHVVSIVLNNVVDDSRVLKTAQAAVNFGFRATIIGFSLRNKLEYTEVNGKGVGITLIPNPRIALRKRGE